MPRLFDRTGTEMVGGTTNISTILAQAFVPAFGTVIIRAGYDLIVAGEYEIRAGGELEIVDGGDLLIL